MDVNGQRGFSVDSASSTASTFLSKSNKIDPYYLITRASICLVEITLYSSFRIGLAKPVSTRCNFIHTIPKPI
jgi:hypothetical protein